MDLLIDIILFPIWCVFGMLWFALVIGGLIFWVLMLIDLINRSDSSFKNKNDKIVWVVLLALTGFIGALIYYFKVKRTQ